MPRNSQRGVGGECAVCSSFLSILLRFLLVQIYITSSFQILEFSDFYIIV